MAFDAFLKIEGIDGDSTDDAHTDWIEIQSYSHGISQPASGSRSSAGSGTAGRADHQDFSIVKNLDKATPKLNLACCNGSHISEVTLELCRAGESKNLFMKYVLSHVFVSGIRPGGSPGGGGDLPLEEITFNYGKVEWEYTSTDPKTGRKGGVVKTYWDTESNKGG